jgi:hypothetical protein
VLLAYTRFYHELDDDIWYYYTQDAGVTWSSIQCMSCVPGDSERAPDLETSLSQGYIHAALFHDNTIDYRRSSYTSPATWNVTPHINDGLDVSSDFPRPGVGINPARPIEEEAGICWTDVRNDATSSYDLYYDGPGASTAGAPEPGAAAPIQSLSCCGTNPFAKATSVCFELAETGPVALSVFDVTGRAVRTLVNGIRPAGDYRVIWNGLTADGAEAPPGVYFVQLKTEQNVSTQEVTILR